MRIIAIGDIHGGLKALIQVLNKVAVKDEDTLIFMGDYVDGWRKKIHLNFFKNLQMHFIDDKNRLFLHAGFTSMHGVKKEVFKTTLYFDRTLWEMALTLDKRIEKNNILYPKRLKHYTEIYIGHTPTTNFECDIPMNAANIWNIDTGAAFRGKISAMDIKTKEVWQSDNLPSLYPNELGRNK